ncbi:MAG: thioredoxin [Dysgonomonas sp.]|nr:thioredoxin [Dysgonomonas sp.]
METFKDIITGDKPVLVDFYATWCGPCKAMSPIIDSLAKELKEHLRVIKVDIDKNQPTAAHYRVQAVPTFVLFKKGEIVWRNSGGMDKATLLQHIRNYI